MAQFLRPDGVISQGSWTGGFADIDEATPNDADRAYSANNPGGSIFEVSLSDPADTPDTGTSTIRYRHGRVNNGTLSGTGTATTLDVSVMQGGITIASDAQQAPGGAYVTRSWTPDLSAVTNWNDLRLRFVPGGGGGSPSNRRGVAISFAEGEVPDGAPPVTTIPVTAASQASEGQAAGTNAQHLAAVLSGSIAATAQPLTTSVSSATVSAVAAAQLASDAQVAGTNARHVSGVAAAQMASEAQAAATNARHLSSVAAVQAASEGQAPMTNSLHLSGVIGAAIGSAAQAAVTNARRVLAVLTATVQIVAGAFAGPGGGGAPGMAGRRRTGMGMGMRM